MTFLYVPERFYRGENRKAFPGQSGLLLIALDNQVVNNLRH